MGQTVRSQGPYDRVWIPGSSPDRNGKPQGSKIEYLEDRRRAKQGASARPQPEGLQYDFNFSRAAARHGDRPPRQHHARESEPVRQIPKGIGGRQRSQQARPAPKKTAAPRRRPAQTGKPPQIRESAQMKPADRQRPRPQKTPVAVQKAPAAPKGKPQRPAEGKPRRKNGTADGRPAARKTAASPKHVSGRPQRDTMTDFHSVNPGEPKPKKEPQSRQNAKKTKTVRSQQPGRRQTKKGHDGHGRKLTPTYELKTGGKRGSKKRGAQIMEGGVVGFDMGSYVPEPRQQNPGPHSRSRIRGVISAALTIAIVFVLLTAVLAGQERLSDYSHQNAALEKSISSLEEEISKLKMQVALEEDLGNIQERAEALGMTHPANDQVQYVRLESTDQLREVPSLAVAGPPAAEAPTNGLIENIVAWFSALFSGAGAAA